MKRLDLIKLLAPGFLPLVVFIIADSFFGVTVGLIVAVGFGLGEAILTFLRQKRIDTFILLDTGLIVALGGISLLLRNDIFFKLKPVLIELIFCFLLGISVFSRKNVVMMMMQRYLKHVALGPEQVRQMKASMRLMFFAFSLHTALTAYAAFFMSRRAWAFISGGLFYLLFAAIFLWEWARTLRQRRAIQAAVAAADGEEWFDLVDPQGRVIGRAPRTRVHAGRGLLHPVVHLHLINRENRIFLQKRSLSKEIQPGKWDTAVGGHVRSGESIEAGLKREAEEELGLGPFKALLFCRYVWESEVESELVFMFVTHLESAPCINRQEMDEGKFWKVKNIRERLGKNVFTPNFEFEFDLLLKGVFKEARDL